MEINLDNNDFLQSKNKYYHNQCWIDWRLSMKRNIFSYNELCGEAKALSQLTQQKIEEEKNKVKLYNFIVHNYNLANLDRGFYNRIAEVINGTRQGLVMPIPIEHLLEMWTSYMKKLNEINGRNLTMGKNIYGMNRVYYDLSILINKYSDFLNYKQKQKEIENARDNTVSQKSITEAIRQTPSRPKKQDGFNLYDMLDEI